MNIPFFSFNKYEKYYFFIFGCWLLPEKFSFAPKYNGFARVWGRLQLPQPVARTPMSLPRLLVGWGGKRPSHSPLLDAFGVSFLSVFGPSTLDASTRSADTHY